MKKWIVLLLVASTLSAQQISKLIYEIRDPQTHAPRFRECLEKIGEYLALDIANHLPTKEVQVTTVTGGVATHSIPDEAPVLVTILRAGLPLTFGVQKIFPGAEVGFIGMARNEETLKADVSYVALPNMRDKYVILIDTMLATGGSFLDALEKIEAHHPKKIVILAAIAAEFGIARILARYPTIEFFLGTTDPSLDDKGFIIPGLGDAGDRCYGLKY